MFRMLPPMFLLLMYPLPLTRCHLLFWLAIVVYLIDVLLVTMVSLFLLSRLLIGM
jgi:hypothetical protein